MKLFPILLLSLFLLSCGPTVTLDYDEKADFSGYNTYDYFPNLDSGLSQLDDDRIIQITDSLLQQRGFSKSETPQLYINFFSTESVLAQNSSIGIGIGGGGGNVGVGVSGGIPIGGRTVQQRLTMDLIDAANDDLVWQAVGESKRSENARPEQREAYYSALLQKMLKNYPPE